MPRIRLGAPRVPGDEPTDTPKPTEPPEPDLSTAPQPPTILESRPPSLQDLIEIGKQFEQHGVEYVLIGGMAMNYHGRARATEDIDFLVRISRENFARIREALSYLPDKASLNLDPDASVKDLSGTYACVRIADEIIIDLIGHVGDLRFENAGIETKDYDGAVIRIADLETMLRSKRGIARDKDIEDRQYLEMIRGGGQ